MRQQITTDSSINGQPVRASKGYPVVINIVEGFQNQLDYMLTHCYQVLYASCVINYPIDYEVINPSSDISSAMRKFHMKANRENLLVMTTWTLELNSYGQYHFNVLFLADGNVIQNGYTLMLWLNDIWTRQLDLDSRSRYVHLNLNDPQYYPPAMALGLKPAYQQRIRVNDVNLQVMTDNVVNAASYYAKVHTKEELSNQRTFGHTRIPRE